MAQETLEQTQRRLAGGMAPSTPATSPVFDELPRQPRRGSGGGTLRGIIVLAVLVAVGLAAFLVYLGLVQAGAVEDKWTSYPGSAFVPSEAVLAGDSLETMQERGERANAEVQDALAGYGLEWARVDEGLTAQGSNGYGGESMLYTFAGTSLIGTAQLSDPDARERITEIITEIMEDDPDVEIFLSNEQFTGNEAETRFGSADRDEQALWEVQASERGWVALTVSLSVYDASVPTGSDFSAPFWVPSDSTATLFVRVTTFAPHVLSESDRNAFIEALEPYEGQAKPLWRG